jgi:Domain of unknown function (DUF3597)
MLRFTLLLGAIRLGVRLLRKFHPCEGPMTDAEVDRVLAMAAADKPGVPDWRNSIVDLLKIMEQDSSFGARAEWWAEMGHRDIYSGTAEQNVQMHKEVTKKIAERELVVP